MKRIQSTQKARSRLGVVRCSGRRSRGRKARLRSQLDPFAGIAWIRQCMQKRTPVYSPVLLRGQIEALEQIFVAERVGAFGRANGQDSRGWEVPLHLTCAEYSTVLSQVFPHIMSMRRSSFAFPERCHGRSSLCEAYVGGQLSLEVPI
jgi:hypothetical protein